ncbi:GtrA family protein [Streptosporangium sp. NBC_01755]|uniref:GtrA family protein n=1 Tax=unclassified Streptosporangium TaxID=2632669 RepID=UPI002DD92EFB|nr:MULTISPECIES: GtrA family protein [unclassified Streptosporangium]WSA27662.1 GtrA family protein [Streptosporangium sp. NBC_01810]WSD00863.1 GtrA family protein [Streptosporangium sp. NBC_01755]
MVEVENRTARNDNSLFGRLAVISAFGDHRITYLLAGAMTAVVYCALLGLGLLAAEDRVPYLFLVVVSHLTTVVIVYPWYRLVVFRGSGDSWIGGYLRFYAVGLSFLAVSVIGVPLLVELAGIPVMVAQGVVIATSPPLSYAINRAWVFRNRGRV